MSFFKTQLLIRVEMSDRFVLLWNKICCDLVDHPISFSWSSRAVLPLPGYSPQLNPDDRCESYRRWTPATANSKAIDQQRSMIHFERSSSGRKGSAILSWLSCPLRCLTCQTFLLPVITHDSTGFIRAIVAKSV